VDRPVSFDRARLVRRGKEVRLAFAPDAGGRPVPDPSLIKLIVKATPPRRLNRSEHQTLAELAAEQGYTRDYLRCLLRLSYLAPISPQPFLDGRQPRAASIAKRLARAANLQL